MIVSSYDKNIIVLIKDTERTHKKNNYIATEVTI